MAHRHTLSRHCYCRINGCRVSFLFFPCYHCCFTFPRIISFFLFFSFLVIIVVLLLWELSLFLSFFLFLLSLLLHFCKNSHTLSLRHCYCRCYHRCIVVCCSVLQCAAVCCNALQCAAVCCNVLQCAAVCCSEPKGTSSPLLSPTHTQTHTHTHAESCPRLPDLFFPSISSFYQSHTFPKSVWLSAVSVSMAVRFFLCVLFSLFFENLEYHVGRVYSSFVGLFSHL